ncbi:hypothetical protein [Teredinibacter turnerae]|uniref:hypothetical protein n=1 Tax=Teredinibacter turnerae TaxID=2426 RepID=UPI00035EABAA|nr:hypothetical protein [Teredinibacter turnerae]
MPQELNKQAIFEYLNSWSGFDKSIFEAGEAYKVILTSGNKRVVITTPFEVGEIFLDFIVDNEPYYSNWYEIMEDPLSEFMAYTWQVADNFLSNNTRVISKGWWIYKTQELQFKSNGTWSNVFNKI